MERLADPQPVTKPRGTKEDRIGRRPTRRGKRGRPAMQSESLYSLLAFATDSVTGSSYHHQSESINPQLSLGVPVRPATRAAVPIQVSGSMLGARARAAEYNAAKAASARQQASQEADGLKVLRPSPTPLSAFARNPSASRNKGNKTFKPLVFTEEGSISSAEQESEEPDSPSPGMAEPPRSASLPPPQTAQNVQPEITRSVQNPQRFEGPYIPFAPRAMMTDDGYFSSHHPQYIPLPHMQQYMHYQTPYANIPAPSQVLSAPHIGWLSSPEQYENIYSYLDTGMPPTTPVPQARPQLERKRESDESAGPEIEREKTQSSQTSPGVVRQALPLGGSTNYVFGPDDLEPAKCEVKQQAREQAYKEEAVATAKFKEESVKEAKSVEAHRRSKAEDELLRLFKTASSHDKPSNSAPDLSGDRKLSDLLGSSTMTQAERRSETVRKSSAPLLPNEADWPYLGRSSAYYSGSENQNAEPKSNLGTKSSESDERLKHFLLEGLKRKTEADAAAAAIRPPPGLHRPKPQKPRLLDSRAEQITNLKFPLVDLHSPEWLEVGPLTEQKRNEMRRIYETVKTCSVSDKYRDTWEDRGGLPRPEFQQYLDDRKQEFLERKKRIDDLADEMQQKWEHGDSFRSATMEGEEAKKQAGFVKAVGGIMSALNMQLDDKTGSHYRGARPYCTVPDYAIRRSVGLGKQGKSGSLFDSEDDADRVVPIRLARDPRFRPQLGDASKVDEARIPRMFVSKRT